MIGEPELGALALAAVVALLSAISLVGLDRLRTPRRLVAPAPSSDMGPETPAVVSLLTSGFVVTPAAAVATLLDLVARGWLRIEAVEDDVVVLADRRGRHGDVLNRYEQQVLNHVHRISAGPDGAVTGAGIELSGLRLPRAWWRRFTRSVVTEARRAGFCRRRWPLALLVVPAAGVVAAGWLVWRAVRTGDSVAVADSLPRRAAAAIVAVACVLIARQIVLRARSRAQYPTTAGAERARAWMGLRAWMEPRGFEQASSTVAGNPSRALGYACGFGLAPRAFGEVPLVPEDDRRVWSNAGGAWHIVTVRYPFRPGFGRRPLLVLVAGLILGVGVILLQRLLLDVARGRTAADLLDEIPDQAGIARDAAVGLAAALIAPLLLAAWLTVAGAFDLCSTVERRGVVVRARRPQRVAPASPLLRWLARRDRYALFIAVDDGRRDRISARLATERTAVPQGAVATVRATPLLGYVRSSAPVGATSPTGPNAPIAPPVTIRTTA